MNWDNFSIVIIVVYFLYVFALMVVLNSNGLVDIETVNSWCQKEGFDKWVDDFGNNPCWHAALLASVWHY